MTQASALYVGKVTHRRLRPRVHALAYRVYMLLLDLDEVDRLDLKVLRRARFGLMSFDPRDHGDGSDTPLRVQTETRLRQAAITGPIGAIRLLTMPRVLGYGFNPISLYFCHRPDGTLAAVVHEVTNTFGERHAYVAPAGETGRVHRHAAPKSLHVSPFMDMDMGYAFRVSEPGERVKVLIDLKDSEGVRLATGFIGERRPLTDGQLLRAWLTHPLLTLKVIGGIHWEALRIWTKGIAYRRKPTPPSEPVTVARAA